MKKFLIALMLLFAIWVRVPPPEPIAFEAWCYVQTVQQGHMIVLASIVHYEWGYIWKVYREPTSPYVQMRGGLMGVEKKWSEARDKVYFQLRGSRMVTDGI